MPYLKKENYIKNRENRKKVREKERERERERKYQMPCSDSPLEIVE